MLIVNDSAETCPEEFLQNWLESFSKELIKRNIISALAMCVRYSYTPIMWSKSGAGVLLRQVLNGPEGGGSVYLKLVDLENQKIDQFEFSIQWGPLGAGPERITSSHCQKNAEKLNHLLKKMEFPSRLQSKKCPELQQLLADEKNLTKETEKTRLSGAKKVEILKEFSLTEKDDFAILTKNSKNFIGIRSDSSCDAQIYFITINPTSKKYTFLSESEKACNSGNLEVCKMMMYSEPDPKKAVLIKEDYILKAKQQCDEGKASACRSVSYLAGHEESKPFCKRNFQIISESKKYMTLGCKNLKQEDDTTRQNCESYLKNEAKEDNRVKEHAKELDEACKNGDPTRCFSGYELMLRTGNLQKAEEVYSRFYGQNDKNCPRDKNSCIALTYFIRLATKDCLPQQSQSSGILSMAEAACETSLKNHPRKETFCKMAKFYSETLAKPNIQMQTVEEAKMECLSASKNKHYPSGVAITCYLENTTAQKIACLAKLGIQLSDSSKCNDSTSEPNPAFSFESTQMAELEKVLPKNPNANNFSFATNICQGMKDANQKSLCFKKIVGGCFDPYVTGNICSMISSVK